MTDVEITPLGRQGKSFSPNKKQVLKIDMTPMVDLGFLLITFFVFTTTMSTPTVTELFMPRDPTKYPTKLIDDLALTIILGDKGRVFYYQGAFEDALKTNSIRETNYSVYAGIGNTIRQRQKEIDASRKFTDGKRGLMLLIKPTTASVYKNVVDALDEVMINDVKKYAIVEPTNEELIFLKSLNH